MKFCYFPECGKTLLTVFRAPKDEETRKKWIKFIMVYKENFKDTAGFSLCEIHFDFDDIIDGKARKLLKMQSFPTLSGVSNLKKTKKCKCSFN